MAKATPKAGPAKPARKVSKRSAAKPAKRTSPVKAFKPKTAARTKGHSRRHATRPTCPICGSRDVEVAKPAAKAKAQQKLAAGVVLPFLVDHHAGLTCHSCGYREEAT